MDLPFDGAISRFFETEAPEAVREAIRNGDRRFGLAVGALLVLKLAIEQMTGHYKRSKFLPELRDAARGVPVLRGVRADRGAVVGGWRDDQPLPHKS